MNFVNGENVKNREKKMNDEIVLREEDQEEKKGERAAEEIQENGKAQKKAEDHQIHKEKEIVNAAREG